MNDDSRMADASSVTLYEEILGLRWVQGTTVDYWALMLTNGAQ